MPGTDARDSLVGLGLLAGWHLVFWVWGIPLTDHYGLDGPGGMFPDGEQLQALAANAAIAACFNFCFMMGSTLAGPVPIIVGVSTPLAPPPVSPRGSLRRLLLLVSCRRTSDRLLVLPGSGLRSDDIREYTSTTKQSAVAGDLRVYLTDCL